MRFPVTCPRAAGEGGERPSTPNWRPRPRRQTAAGRSVILTLPDPPGERGSIARGVRRPALGSAGLDFSGRPGPGRRSFTPARGVAAQAPPGSRRVRLPARSHCGHCPPGLERVRSRQPESERDLSPGRETKAEDQRARPASLGRGGSGRGAALAAARLRASLREPRPRGPRSAARTPQRGWASRALTSRLPGPGSLRHAAPGLRSRARGRGRERPRRDREGGNSAF